MHDELCAVAEHDHEALCADERAPPLDDDLQHVLERDLLADCDGHVADCLEAEEGFLKLSAGALAGLIQAGVLDSDRRPPRKDHRGLLVGLGELLVGLLGEIQVAPHTLADHHRHTQEAAHRRMSSWKSVAARVLADITQAQGARILDQLAQHAPPPGQITHRAADGLIDARREELLELRLLIVEDTDGGVSRPRDRARPLEQPLQHDRGIELGRQRSTDIQQAANPLRLGRFRHLQSLEDGMTAPFICSCMASIPLPGVVFPA
jgi:hypothetical protein